MISRKTFYERFRAKFGRLTQSNVDAINFLLDKLDSSKVFKLKNDYAYILSTIYHETAHTFKPITELGSQRYLKSKRYYPYIGRGFVQLTWDWNYEKFGKLLKIDLLGNPELANDPETAWKILELGMSKGLYTGKKLGDYVNENKIDYRGARKVINGTDRAELLAGYAKKFEDCIEFTSNADAQAGYTVEVDPESKV